MLSVGHLGVPQRAWAGLLPCGWAAWQAGGRGGGLSVVCVLAGCGPIWRRSCNVLLAAAAWSCGCVAAHFLYLLLLWPVTILVRPSVAHGAGKEIREGEEKRWRYMSTRSRGGRGGGVRGPMAAAGSSR